MEEIPKHDRRPTRLSNDSSISAMEGAEGVPNVTVGERILVHLSGFLRHADSYECPVEMTQDGIANALLLSRAHVALELKRVKSNGKVQERLAPVAKARSRRKVGELTPAGQEISRRMRERARARTIELSAPEGRRPVLGAEAIEALRHAGLREAEAVQRILASDVVELPRPEPTKPAPVPSRTFFGRDAERRILEGWLASDSRAVAVVIGVAGIGKSALLARALADERRPKLLRRVYAHDDAHGILSSFADFLAHQNRRRLKAAIMRPAYDPIEVIAVLREDLAGCVLAIDDLHACPAADALLRAVVEHPPEAKILVATLTQPRRLVRRALLHHRDEGYLLHDLVKEFFLRRMGDLPRREAHVRAASYWASRQDLLEEAYHRIESGDLGAAVARLVDVGPAFAESARAGDLEAALLRVPQDSRLDALLAETQMFLGKFAEARAVLERIARTGTPAERLRAHIQLGRIANRLASYQDARAILAEAVREASALAVPEVEGEALRALGGVERKLGDLPAAMGHLERAADLLPHGSRERVRTLTDLGAVLIARGDHPRAKTRLLEAASSVRSGTRDDAAIQINLGIVSSREGDARTAAETFARSAEIALGAGDVRFASYALANAVDNFLRLGAVEAAATSAERALRLAETIGDPVALSTAKANLGLVFAKRGEWTKAEAHLLESVEMIARLENPYSLATRYEEIARLYETQGRGGDAAPWRGRGGDPFARPPSGARAPPGGARTWGLWGPPRPHPNPNTAPETPPKNPGHLYDQKRKEEHTAAN